MVVVKILETGEELDVIGRVGFTRQVGDIGDIGKVNSSYSWTLKFPKTDHNTEVLKGLGLVGSTSEIPYKEIKVALLHNGTEISNYGDLHITETNEKEYKGNIKEGIIEFFKGVQDDKLGEVDLSDLNHERSFASVTGSYTADLPYKYLMAGYNGRILQDINGVTNFDISNMIPSANCGYLLSQIFNHYGWTFEGLDASDMWMSYPTAKTEVANWEALKGIAVIPEEMNGSYDANIVFERTAIDTSYIEAGNSFGVFEFKVGGNFGINIPDVTWNTGQVSERTISIYINNNLIHSTTGDYLGYYNLPPVQSGDRLAIRLTAGDNHEGSVTYTGELSVIMLGVSDIDFSTPLMDLSVRDFLKEIMTQKASVPVVTDSKRKHIVFNSITERLNNGSKILESRNFIKRTSEKYTYRSYGQNNFFTHKYDGDNERFNDGNLRVSNENLKVENKVYEGLSYSPLRNRLEVLFENENRLLLILKMFDISVEEDDSGNIQIEYDPLDERFYFNRFSEINDAFYLNGAKYTGVIPVAEPILWSDIIGNSEQYKYMDRLIQRAKIIKIKSALSDWDISQLRFDKLYYLENELGYYLINRATFDNEKGSEIELIKID